MVYLEVLSLMGNSLNNVQFYVNAGVIIDDIIEKIYSVRDILHLLLTINLKNK